MTSIRGRATLRILLSRRRAPIAVILFQSIRACDMVARGDVLTTSRRFYSEQREPEKTMLDRSDSFAVPVGEREGGGRVCFSGSQARVSADKARWSIRLRAESRRGTNRTRMLLSQSRHFEDRPSFPRTQQPGGRKDTNYVRKSFPTSDDQQIGTQWRPFRIIGRDICYLASERASRLGEKFKRDRGFVGAQSRRRECA